MNKSCLILGGGFAGLSCGSILANEGFKVTLLEKQTEVGGRCRSFSENGFLFDMGPSWYWMPDVYERFFNRFGYKTEDLIDLIRLDPSYKVFFKKQSLDIPADFTELKNLFESIEKGSAKKLEIFMKEAQYKYEIGMKDLVYKASLSIFEFCDINLLKDIFKVQIFTSISSHIKKYFTHPILKLLLEFPVLFLGAKPSQTPALYSLMNYADSKLGTWYPLGGMSMLSAAFKKIAIEQGCEIKVNQNIKKIITKNNQIQYIETENKVYKDYDYIISAMDYPFTESLFSEVTSRNYTNTYWENKKLSPSCFLYYLGINKKMEGLMHHNLFFDAPFETHLQAIYDDNKLPKDPLFYVCVPSKSDKKVAPMGHENLFILIPIAAGIKETDEIREEYLQLVLDRIESRTKQSIKNHIIYKKTFATRNFINEYNSYKGNAYGLANTLSQTAFLKPKIKNKKIKNFFYCGQMTVPGPGLPPAIISGEIVANYIINLNKK